MTVPRKVESGCGRMLYRAGAGAGGGAHHDAPIGCGGVALLRVEHRAHVGGVGERQA